MLDEWPNVKSGNLLEIGCGDGFLSKELSNHFGRVVSTDIHPTGQSDNLIRADAQKLPFSDSSFDVIFSSNVLEHIPNIDACLSELYSVSTDDVLMVHTMPTIWWKTLQYITHPMHICRKLFNNFRPGKTSQTNHVDSSHFPIENWRKSSERPLLRRLLPAIHGVSDNHLLEFLHFRTRWWESQFNAHGFITLKKTNLFVHSGYELFPYKLMRFRNALARTYFPCVTAYWVVKSHS